MNLQTHRERLNAWRAIALVVLAVLVPTALTACDSSSPPVSQSSPAPTPTPTSDPLEGWTLEQKVGQVFMVGIPLSGDQQASRDAVSQLHVGNVFLAGRSTASVEAIRDLVNSFTDLVSETTTHSMPLFISTDQEGGEVQVLQGPGFSSMPTGLAQANQTPSTLQANAKTWGNELAAAGLNLNLAPVMGLLPDPATAPHNPPIGQFQREYGYTVDSVTSHANAFSAGMESAGIDVTIKHFPGLGRVTGNTDTTANVTDTVTTRNDPSLQTFRSGIEAGAAFVMTSTAIYSLIDSAHPAAFSPVVVTGMLRGDLGFTGVIITDDLSGAVQVEQWSPADRATMSIDAGCDMVLVSKTPDVINKMVNAVVQRAQSDTAFAAKVDAAARKVLTAKEHIR